MPQVSFTSVKGLRSAGDGAIDVVFTTKYSGDLSVKVTRECLLELVTALNRDIAFSSTVDASFHAGGAGSAPSAAVPQSSVAATDSLPTEWGLSVHVPKRWAVGATQTRDMVLLLFDPETERQASFGLGATAAIEIAKALVQKARLVAGNIAGTKPAATE